MSGWKYEPKVKMQPGLTTVEEVRDLSAGLLYVRDTRGRVANVRGWNKKSVAVEMTDYGTGEVNLPTRFDFKDIDSFGVKVPVESEPESEPAETGHAARDHALLSASGAHRWINCPPSAVLEDAKPESTSSAADQGTAAHELAEYKLQRALKRRAERPTSTWQDEEMETLTDGYRDFVLETLAAAKESDPGATLFIEQRLDFSHIVPGGFGTGDAVIASGDTLHIIDLKYGAGVQVEAEGNPQLRLYALGAVATFGMLFGFDKVAMTIYQPRRNHVSTETIGADELAQWARDVVEPAAKLAEAGEGEFQAGEWCQFCKLSATCRARAEQNLEIARFEFAPPAELTEAEIADIVLRAPEITKWLKAVEAWALGAALDQGAQLPGLKVVAGRSMRKWSDDAAVADAAAAAGFTDVWNRKLIGIGEMEKLMGKKEMAEILGDLIIKPEGKPTLVPETDKRKALEIRTVHDDFGA